jgi:hypothetical protein
MPWGEKESADQKGDFGEEDFFDAVTLPSPNAVAHCQVTVEFKASPGLSENAVINVYGTLDGPPAHPDPDEPVWDVQPLAGLSFILSQDRNPNRVSFIVSGVRRFRVGVRAERPGILLGTANFSYRIGTPEFNIIPPEEEPG